MPIFIAGSLQPRNSVINTCSLNVPCKSVVTRTYVHVPWDVREALAISVVCILGHYSKTLKLKDCRNIHTFSKITNFSSFGKNGKINVCFFSSYN